MSLKTGNIALAGRPNAGKSTFLNAVLGQKVSIVSDKAQTTRNRILGIYHGQNLQIGFIDLPGIHKPQHRMNRLMMRAVGQGLHDADLILHFIDGTQKIGPGDRFVADFLKQTELPVIVIVNKIDLINKAKLISLLQTIHDQLGPQEMIPISAKEQDNLEKVLKVASQFLHDEEGEARFDQEMVTDQTLRFMAQEFIREKILHYTDQEIPHATAVTITELQENEDAVLMAATIWAERANQRKILLGKQGQMIRKIRHGARRGLKQLFEKPVTLELHVKVKEDWRNQDQVLKNLDINL